ncbi:hypothetical protein R1sor_004021 [Riccia sorocarpa]|uniref:UNC93-like protein n=1 Tax=Riccia sorocarpa TaxID=122646 RepID=A0ABD3H9E5_9MARC
MLTSRSENLIYIVHMIGKRVKSIKMFRSERWRYDSPLVQIVVLGVLCFCCPGMFNAINGLGAVGKADATTTDNANTALAVTFATCSLIAGAVFNILGHRVTLFLGGLAYVLYIGSYLSYAPAFVITAGGVLGVGAGFLWASQGAIMISYPEERNKGKYFGLFWSIFNMGGVLGSLIPLIIEWNSGKSSVSTATYISFMVIMFCGTLLSLALLPPSRVTRNDGEAISMHQYSSWKLEAVEVAKLFGDWRMLALLPMFFASNWFYTYQFNCFNGGGLFTTRTRAFNGTFYWFAQILGSNLMGNFLDSERVSTSRRRRAEIGLVVLLILTTTTWGGGYAFQRSFTRRSVFLLEQKIDLKDSRQFAGPVTLYTCYGFFDAFWQTYCYWIMGALTNDTRTAARYSGFYKAVQNAGAALAGQVDAHKVSFMNQLIINWATLTFGCICAFFVTRTVTSSSDSLDSKIAKDSRSLQSGLSAERSVSRTRDAETLNSKEAHDSVSSVQDELMVNKNPHKPTEEITGLLHHRMELMDFIDSVVHGSSPAHHSLDLTWKTTSS